MSNFRLYFALLSQMPKKLKTDKLMFHNKAKKFVSLQILKAIILCSLKKNGKLFISRQCGTSKMLVSLTKTVKCLFHNSLIIRFALTELSFELCSCGMYTSQIFEKFCSSLIVLSK